MHSIELREHRSISVLVLDDLPLRRAAVAAFLVPWCRSQAVELVQGSLTYIPAPVTVYGMVILPVGGVPIERSAALRRMFDLVGEFGSAPVVVLSDGSAVREVALAFEAGVKGYLPASMEPELALRALTFILKGGHFFPPTALPLQTHRLFPAKPPSDRLMSACGAEGEADCSPRD